MKSLPDSSRSRGLRLLILVLAGAFTMTGCTSLNSWSQRKVAAAQVAQSKEQHAQFRSKPGWRKTTYRNADLLAKAGAQNTSVEIALREQRGLLLVDGAIAMDFPVATGRSSHPTPKGSYKILDKKKDYCSNLYGRIVSGTGETLVSDADTREDAVPEGGSFIGARMPYWMRITPDGLGMHVGHVPAGGRPASHGCIRLKKDVAVELFGILGMGAPVTVALFAPVLGGPAGVESVVTSEAAHNAPPRRSKPKPAPVPPPALQDPAAAPSSIPVPAPASGLPPAPPAGAVPSVDPAQSVPVAE